MFKAIFVITCPINIDFFFLAIHSNEFYFKNCQIICLQDDDSDLEVELEPSPAVNGEAMTEAAACVKVALFLFATMFQVGLVYLNNVFDKLVCWLV